MGELREAIVGQGGTITYSILSKESILGVLYASIYDDYLPYIFSRFFAFLEIFQKPLDGLK